MFTGLDLPTAALPHSGKRAKALGGVTHQRRVSHVHNLELGFNGFHYGIRPQRLLKAECPTASPQLLARNSRPETAYYKAALHKNGRQVRGIRYRRLPLGDQSVSTEKLFTADHTELHTALQSTGNTKVQLISLLRVWK